MGYSKINVTRIIEYWAKTEKVNVSSNYFGLKCKTLDMLCLGLIFC